MLHPSRYCRGMAIGCTRRLCREWGCRWRAGIGRAGTASIARTSGGGSCGDAGECPAAASRQSRTERAPEPCERAARSGCGGATLKIAQLAPLAESVPLTIPRLSTKTRAICHQSQLELSEVPCEPKFVGMAFLAADGS